MTNEEINEEIKTLNENEFDRLVRHLPCGWGMNHFLIGTEEGDELIRSGYVKRMQCMVCVHRSKSGTIYMLVYPPF